MKKKRLGIILVLVSLMVLMTGGPVAAWDVEDPEVANNADFIVGVGIDVDAPSVETHTGGQLPWGGDGYNLYSDDATDTGNLDVVVITTFTPSEIDLPSGFFIWATGASPDTWYWATEPRGYKTHHSPPPRYLHIYLPDDDRAFRLHSHILQKGAVDFCDGTWRIQIPAETQIERADGVSIRKLFIDESGQITNEDIVITYSQPGDEIIIAPCPHPPGYNHGRY